VRKYLFDNRWVFDTGDQLDGTGIFAASISLLEGPQPLAAISNAKIRGR
jgi:hypothetical protein